MTALAPPLRRESTRGILFLVAGVAVFSLQDVILKWLSGDYPLHQAMVIRSLTAIPFLLGLLHLEGGTKLLFTAGTRAMVGRGLIMFLAYFTYYIALPALPLATTVALYFSAPLFITALSVVILGETVGPRRWIALALGFAGVVIVVRPGSSLFDWAAILPVLSGLCYALSMIHARKLGTTETAAALAEEFEIVAHEVKAGKERVQVLRDMAERVGLSDITSFVTTMIQSATFGTSIAEALRVYSAEMRDKRVMRAEEKANTLPTKLTLGTMMFTVPPLLLMLIGPSLYGIATQFGGG